MPKAELTSHLKTRPDFGKLHLLVIDLGIDVVA